jgi:TPR repeat protein
VKALAERGVASAQHSLGFMYVNGQGVPRNYELAVAWYRKAASRRPRTGPVQPRRDVPEGPGRAQDLAQAAVLVPQAAEQGYAPAQYNLGWLYAKGQGVPADVARRCTGSARPPTRATPAPSTTSA